ncbi:prephenate dehydratase [Kaistella jeonii]|uniref:prephenate dehydratase n=1 Tax=Kaistella jeonii TaxID=266749 RepID=A0A0C1FA87_9FLAO|nr:prephenate dehydratase [Kaistella jeonii]KIA88818.1 prephenate dehydratase [Kaistella jeonii]SFC14057.1 prephenate dehydratase [Kaistella jeonii]VEI97451.1 Prephenate dehydratase [Kaistella jeonii]
MKIAFLGPHASFTQLACSQIFPDNELIPQSSILDCFNAVKNGEVEKAVVPLENSIEGTVSVTLDYLYHFEDIFIETEAVMSIAHHLMINPNNEDFEKIISHPQALAQTFHFRNDHFKNMETQDFSSTSASAKLVAENPQEKWAAIANSYAAKLYGLKIINSDIQDFEQNHTKFIVISKKKNNLQLDLPKTSEKTSLIITLPEDHAGGLHQVLSVFAWRKMNLSKIESRTLKTGLGNYFFFINIANEWHSILSENALAELRSFGANVKFLGHYNEYVLEG